MKLQSLEEKFVNSTDKVQGRRGIRQLRRHLVREVVEAEQRRLEIKTGEFDRREFQSCDIERYVGRLILKDAP
jgi:hypothetical protein